MRPKAAVASPQCIAPPIALVNGFSDLCWYPSYEKGAWMIGADSRKLYRYFSDRSVFPSGSSSDLEIHMGERCRQCVFQA